MSQHLGDIDVGGKSVAIAGLEIILAEVVSLQIVEEKLLKTELLRRVQASNYVPASAEEEYAEALLREYKKILGQEVKEELGGNWPSKYLGPAAPVANVWPRK